MEGRRRLGVRGGHASGHEWMEGMEGVSVGWVLGGKIEIRKQKRIQKGMVFIGSIAIV